MFNFFKKKNKVVTRIAPSPTGIMHVGTARTALFSYLYAKKFGGKFIMRVEDTDKERSTKEFEDNIVDSMKWLGLDWDEFYRQSERTDVYKKYMEKIISEDKAYVSKESEGPRTEVIRFRNPNKKVTFHDEIRGDITFDTTELGDFVIAKSITEPLYHFAVVVDDFDMGVTHIIRGEDGISNTPRQILIQEAIGAPLPIYAHLPLILGKDRSKMSKRHGASSITDFIQSGFTKEAMVNFIAFLGWNPGTEKEMYTIDELIADFDLTKISKSGAIFNEEKLDWFNNQYLRKMNDSEYLEYIKELNLENVLALKLKNIILERISNKNDLAQMIQDGELDFATKEPEFDINKIVWKSDSLADSKIHLQFALEKFKTLGKDEVEIDQAKNLIWDYAGEKGRGNVLWPLRYVLSGKDKSPDPFTIISIIGVKKSISRIENAVQKINV